MPSSVPTVTPTAEPSVQPSSQPSHTPEGKTVCQMHSYTSNCFLLPILLFACLYFFFLFLLFSMLCEVSLPDVDVNGYVNVPIGTTSIPAHAFESCTALKSITLPAGLLSIGEWAFYNTALVTVAIPVSVTHIYSAAFASCTNLLTASYYYGTTVDSGAFGSNTIITIMTTIGWYPHL